MRSSCQGPLEDTIKIGLQARQKQIKLLVYKNSKLQDLIVCADGSVTKDKSGQGCSINQGASTICEDGILPIRSQHTAGQWKWKQSHMLSIGLHVEVQTGM